MNKKEKEIASKDISSNPNDQSMTKEQYWKKNISCVLILLAVWFIVSYGCGILFVETLNEIKIGGAGFGFWMAQKGSIYVFVVLIFIYVRLMNRLEGEYASGIKNGNSTQDLGKEKS